MALERYAILIWRDATGQFTSCGVQHASSAVAVARTRAAAVDQLHDFYTFFLKRQPWLAKSQIAEASLVQYKIPVRPEFRDSQDHVFTSEPVTLAVACVHGKLESGMLFCAVPQMALWFYYHEGDKLKDSVTHYVQQQLRGSAPQELARFGPMEEMELDEVLVHAPPVPIVTEKLEIDSLTAVADAITSKDFRLGLSRPWQRETDVNRLIESLIKDKSSLILVGNSGSGKSAVLVEAARRVEPLLAAQSPDLPRTPRFWMTSGGRLISGMRYLGQWEERVEQVIAQLATVNGTLCLEDLLSLVHSAGRDPSTSIAAFLVPYILRGELRIIAEATPEEIEACRRVLPAIVDCCRLFTIAPMTASQAAGALTQVAALHSQNRRVEIQPAAVNLLQRLFARFLPYREMPGPGGQALTELFDQAARDKRAHIRDADIITHFVRQTGLPQWLLRDDQPLERATVLQDLQKQIIGQDPACAAVADLVTTFKAGLNDPSRPIGVLLFTGPTGVGKTELAKSLSTMLFGHGEDADRLIRLDMSEFGSPGSAERLLGPPDGEPSDLIKRVRQQPFCIVLLDEIEKAAPEIFDVLLGVFDEGRLTDRYGRLTTFRSAVIIMTSNIGSAKAEPFGLSRPRLESSTLFESEVMAFFRPEFFNRIDRVLTFAPLAPASVRQIATRELQAIAAREGITRRKIHLTWTPEVIDHLASAGFDHRYGARPLQRTIERLIAIPLARHLLSAKPKRTLHLAFTSAGDITIT